MSNDRKAKSAGVGKLIHLLAAADMTDELLLSNYNTIEARYKESGTWRDLDSSLRDYLLRMRIRIETCVCFGTGTFSGYYDNVHDAANDGKNVDGEHRLNTMEKRHHKSMYELAAFTGAIELIGARPLSFAQEPQYNDFDSLLLQQMQITKVDPPRGFSFVKENSLIYCPGVPFFVLHGALARTPVLSLTGNLVVWLQDYLENLPVDSSKRLMKEGESSPSPDEVQLVEQYVATHDARKLESLEITDASGRVFTPFWGLRLYSAKTRSRGLSVTSQTSSDDREVTWT